IAAQQFQERQMQQAKEDASELVAKAREAIKREHDQMLIELKSEVARLVVDTTSKVLGKVLTADDQQRLIQEASRELAA
ncbi:MAG: ATP synthase F0 subunit B, partial [Proteobacteria bacterium]|nr:ATP synthase F0 subunit B [Pseudomonadota bacterium]